MIVRPIDGGVELITQPDHAALAGRIMDRCLPLMTHPRRDSILKAVYEHDRGWSEPDAAPLADRDRGHVLDFVSVPLRIRQGVWPRTIASLADDAYAAALVAQHAITVYDRFSGYDDWAPFFAEMKRAREVALRRTDVSLEELMDDYAFVRLGDLVSLAFCVQWSEPQRFGQWTVRRYGERVVVSPDPFGGAEIPIEVCARRLRKPRFISDEDLRRALGAANSIVLRGVVSGRS